MRKTKTRKAISIVLTFMMVFGLFAAFPSQEAEASVSYVWHPEDVEPDDEVPQRLGTFDLTITDIVYDHHEAYVELPSGYQIDQIRVTDRSDDGADAPHTIEIDDQGYDVGAGGDNPQNLTINGTNAFSIVIPRDVAEDMENDADFDDFEIRIALMEVIVPEGETGEIYADITRVGGQFVTDSVLVGVIDAGEIQAVVTDLDHFADEGEVTIELTESVAGTWNTEDNYTLKLPRGFVWVDAEFESFIFGDLPAIDDQFTFDTVGRDLTISYAGDGTDVRTRFDFSATIQVERYDLANEGDIVATVGGGYDFTPDELVVGRYGDFFIHVTPDALETVYAGEVGQEIADITLEEEITNSLVDGRSVMMELPEGVVWQDAWDPIAGEWMTDDVEMANVSDDDVTLRFVNFINERTARFLVDAPAAERNEPETLVFEDLEVAISADFRGDIEVTFSGTAGVSDTVLVAEAVAPATVEVAEVPQILRGATGQDVGDIYITEAYAGAFDIDKYIALTLDEHVRWDSIELEVEEGDIELGSPIYMDRNTMYVRVTLDSDEEASTIRVSGTVRSLDTIPYEESFARLAGDAVVDAPTVDIRDAWYLERFAIAEAVEQIVAPSLTEVVMWVGLTTYTVDGEAKEMDVAPFIENDRTFVPISFIANEFGLESDWGPRETLTEWVTFEGQGILVEIEIGSPYITVTEDGVSRTVTSDVAAQIVNDRTYLPLRAVGEIFGAEFDWGPKESLTEWVSFTLPY